MVPPIPTGTLGTTLGVTFAGLGVTLLVYGLNLGQLVVYFRAGYQGSSSRPFEKLLIVLWKVDSIHVALIVSGLWIHVVTSRGDIRGLSRSNWPWIAQVYVTTVSNLVVHNIFAYRIWIMSRGGRLIPLSIALLSLYVAAMSSIYATRGICNISHVTYENLEVYTYMGYGTEMLVDSVIAIAMTRLLIRFRTGTRRSDSILQTFVMYSINTGLLTTFCVALSLVCYLVIPHSLAYLAFYFVFGKLYLNSLLGTLNARSQLRPTARRTSVWLTTGVVIQLQETGLTTGCERDSSSAYV
ncbi:hypothetical protein OBBRIDRAFT_332760 [Obba rivulosa]|uniref:DUF6534 domain-containing protein n=1 Tax=Obba rivulosa TaxID=1052685 RepID=A0A8E2DGU1_9APHY|nr:hypothetical protein OBBRIDRAFT_332760 [Obba rivulosa]